MKKKGVLETLNFAKNLICLLACFFYLDIVHSHLYFRHIHIFHDSPLFSLYLSLCLLRSASVSLVFPVARDANFG